MTALVCYARYNGASLLLRCVYSSISVLNVEVVVVLRFEEPIILCQT